MRRQVVTSKIKEAVHKMIPEVKAWIYGSEARGEARADSDIDVLLLVKKDSLSFDDRKNLIAPLYDINQDFFFSIIVKYERNIGNT